MGRQPYNNLVEHKRFIYIALSCSALSGTRAEWLNRSGRHPMQHLVDPEQINVPVQAPCMPKQEQV